MIKLGITGGLGSGKSTATEYFRSKGAFICDADDMAKEHLLHSKSLQEKLINAFGKEIVDNRNDVDLEKLSDHAFSSNINQNILNRIIWPEVYLLIEKAFNEAKSIEKKLFIVDAALLIEANFTKYFDIVLLIKADKEIRISRALKRNNISKEQINQRISLQMSDAQKQKHTDVIIQNNDSLGNYYNHLEIFYRSLEI